MTWKNDDFGSFIKENVNLGKDYLETRMEIYRLKGIRQFSRTAGHFMWMMVSLVLVFLVIIFLGLVFGLWMSEITGSYLKGFSIATLAIILLIVVFALLRKTLFVDPLIRTCLRNSKETLDETDNFHRQIH